MPKAQISNPNGGRQFQPPRQVPNWVVAVACGLVATLLTVGFLDYSPEQDPFHTTNPTDTNLVGIFGAYGSSIAFRSLGVTAWLIPIFLFWLAYVAIRHVRQLAGTRLIAMAACIAAFSGLASMFAEQKSTNVFPYGLGGLLGRLVYDDLLRDSLGAFGSVLLLGTLYVFGLLFIFTKDIGAEFEKLAAGFTAWRLARSNKGAPPASKPGAGTEEPATGAPKVPPFGPAEKKVFVPKAGGAAGAEQARPAGTATAGKIQLNIVKPEEPRKAKAIPLPAGDDKYRFPPLSLLKEQVRPMASNSEEEHSQNAGNLMRILGEFGVEVSLGEIHVGPVITRYEVVPAAGVRVERISSLDKNIALGMRAQSVRILAPIPGKAAVGVEVPNQHPTPVGLREVLESEDWVGARAELPIVLGKDVSGQPLVSDLAKMPHLLIAGATGSGKSVCVNAIVASILYSKSPRDVRLIMVDPKVVELKIFNSLPHMLIPVLTEVKKVPGALKWLLAEMEQRYQIFGKTNVRNIVGFNSRKRTGGAAADGAQTSLPLPGIGAPPVDDGIEVPPHLPYIVVIIDELADLMMIAPAEIETNVARLAQLARAAGIHLIIATQRPSVNVVTGVIKANLPSRIAFQMASQVDSRTVLDTKGAETLIGRGDMLFTPPGTSRVVRAQGAFVSDDEIQKIVAYSQENNDPPVYAHSVQQQIDRAARDDDEEGEFGEEGEMGDDEDLYQQALEVLRATRRASTSMLQRRLRIGYNRAARIMELMEEKGVVGPENGSSPREILVDLDKI
jgi:S-DNA-T family DNA segregation ATPase FtsK/SpoIIIE